MQSTTPNERNQRSQKKLEQRRASKLNKLKAELRQLAPQKAHLLPQNTITQVSKIFSLTQGEDLGLIAQKYSFDFFLMGLIDEDALITDLGLEFLELNQSKQIKLLKTEAFKLPKMDILRREISKKKYKSNKELVEALPEDFFGNIAFQTRVVQLTNILSWIK
ncbi:MAG TPA: hypothetical protein DCS93_23550 [Microscillaceae bacterium]|nr:hypothetical protein [Microscillaceae bacterium]